MSAAIKATRTGLDWVAANLHWWSSRAVPAVMARGAANAIHTLWLQTDTKDPESPEYYNEIGALLRPRFQELPIVDLSLAARSV